MLRRLSYAILAISAGGSVFAQGDPDTITKIIEEGKVRNKTRLTLETICGQYGARLTSSTALEKAQQWAMEQFTSFGCTNVHLEKWGEWPVGFDRAMSGHVGRMLEPTPRNFEYTTASWTPGTKGLKKGGVVMEPATLEEVTKNPGAFRGKWMIMNPTQAGGGRPGGGRPGGGAGGAGAANSGGAGAGGAAGSGRPPGAGAGQAGAQGGGAAAQQPDPRTLIREAAFKAGILGTVAGAQNELVLTGGRYQIEWGKLPTETRITVRKSDYDAIIAGTKAGGKPVMLEFNLIQSFRKGPIANSNVVAEIKGSEKPDEVVIVSGHYDSWDGPGAVGAIDNGTGSSVTIEAARILLASGAKPKRTIRFILWTGEEQGLFGSRGYVKDHAAEMDKISAVLVDDGGTNYWGGYVGLETQRAMFQPSMDLLMKEFPDLPMVFNARDAMPRGGGSDHASFNAVGVPGFFTNETGVSDYNYVHHTQHDKVEAAINKYLIQSSTAAALTAYNIACADGMMPRGPKPSAGGN